MKKGQLRQLVLSLGVGIAVFLVLALGLRWNFLFSAALGVGIYLGLWFLLTPRADPITLYFAQRPDGGEMQALMEEAERDLKAIRSAAGRITDVRTHEDALALTETGDRLYRYLRTGISGSIRRRFRRPTASSPTIWTRWAGSWGSM